MRAEVNCGLYRDDGLGALYGTKRQNEVVKKKICEIFRSKNLKITVEVNLRVVDFLDVTFDLNKDSYSPYLKPNNTLQYVNVASNHPPNILKNIPFSVNKRLSGISKDEETFKQAITPYQEALNTAGYKFKLRYEAQENEFPRA